MRVVVITGSRQWTARKPIERALRGAELLIVGDAEGADALAYEVAVAWDVIVARYVAQWHRYGRGRAGAVRNAAIVRRAVQERAAGMDVRCFAAPLRGSTGTLDCMRRLREQGFVVKRLKAA